jgi:hypothetical protein
MNAAALIDRVREIAHALPDVTEKLSHGEPAFFVRGRMFLTIDNNHHGSGHVAAWCNAPEGAQQSLVAGDPRHFFVPPYVGKAGWLGVRLDSGLDWKVVADLLKQAHAVTGVKKQAGRGATTRARPATPSAPRSRRGRSAR